jgi:NAD(P)-dependent dehydrogenase (short-subunit alcohol dehydrogenase family)
MGYLDDRAGLAGKVAAVVGGAAGIGEAVSLALARAGVDIALCDINEQAIPETLAKVETEGRRALGIVGDACDTAVLQRLYEEIAANFGHLDIVVNVAGGTKRKPFMQMDSADFAADTRRNYGYVLDSTRLAVPLLRKSGRGGSIINFTTIEAHRGAAGFAVYAGAKAALTNFTRALAVELGSERIRVNTLAPDTTPSQGNIDAIPEPLRSRMAEVPLQAWQHVFGMYIPLKTPPMPENLADGVLFLASDLSKFVTGTTLHVDGGTMAAAGFLEWPFGEGHLPVPAPESAMRLFGSGSASS